MNEKSVKEFCIIVSKSLVLEPDKRLLKEDDILTKEDENDLLLKASIKLRNAYALYEEMPITLLDQTFLRRISFFVDHFSQKCRFDEQRFYKTNSNILSTFAQAITNLFSKGGGYLEMAWSAFFPETFARIISDTNQTRSLCVALSLFNSIKTKNKQIFMSFTQNGLFVLGKLCSNCLSFEREMRDYSASKLQFSEGISKNSAEQCLSFTVSLLRLLCEESLLLGIVFQSLTAYYNQTVDADEHLIQAIYPIMTIIEAMSVYNGRNIESDTKDNACPSEKLDLKKEEINKVSKNDDTREEEEEEEDGEESLESIVSMFPKREDRLHLFASLTMMISAGEKKGMDIYEVSLLAMLLSITYSLSCAAEPEKKEKENIRKEFPQSEKENIAKSSKAGQSEANTFDPLHEMALSNLDVHILQLLYRSFTLFPPSHGSVTRPEKQAKVEKLEAQLQKGEEELTPSAEPIEDEAAKAKKQQLIDKMEPEAVGIAPLAVQQWSEWVGKEKERVATIKEEKDRQKGSEKEREKEDDLNILVVSEPPQPLQNTEIFPKKEDCWPQLGFVKKQTGKSEKDEKEMKEKEKNPKKCDFGLFDEKEPPFFREENVKEKRGKALSSVASEEEEKEEESVPPLLLLGYRSLLLKIVGNMCCSSALSTAESAALIDEYNKLFNSSSLSLQSSSSSSSFTSSSSESYYPLHRFLTCSSMKMALLHPFPLLLALSNHDDINPFSRELAIWTIRNATNNSPESRTSLSRTLGVEESELKNDLTFD